MTNQQQPANNQKGLRKKALIILHEETTPAGSTLEWLEQNQFDIQEMYFSKATFLPALDSFDVLFITGGQMNVDEEAEYPWLKTEKKLIADAIKNNKKIVGLCLGAQLIAEQLGAKVFTENIWEVGWQDITWNDQTTLKAFQYHRYQFDLPIGAEKLASSAACANQAFKYKNHVIAFQFHPETTEEWAISSADGVNLPAPDRWVQSAADIKKNCFYLPKLKQWYFNQLDLFLIKN